MKRVILLIICCLIISASVHSQVDTDSVLNLVKENNLQLQALKKHIEAERAGNRTGLNPENPEFGFNYLWGSPAEIGVRTDISLTQTIDFPTSYVYRGQISGLKDEQLVFQYKQTEAEVLLKTRQLCYDLVYYNALQEEREKRLEHAEKIAKSYETQLNAGETGILEYNKSALNLVSLKNDISVIKIKQQALLTELSGLNGNKPVNFDQTAYPPISFSENFDTWYDTITLSYPQLNWLKKQVEVQEKQEQLNFALSLPKISTGYMSESVGGEDLRGLTLGVSIPLWADRNKVKYAKLKTEATREFTDEMEIHVYNRIKILHSTIIKLKQEMEEYSNKVQELTSTELLMFALEKGEINLIDYFNELKYYYESTDQLLEMERDLNKSYAELLLFL